jgi:hypothetical protein
VWIGGRVSDASAAMARQPDDLRRTVADWGPIEEVETGSVRRIGDYSYRAQVDGLSRDGRNVLVGDRSVELDRHWRVDVIPYTWSSAARRAIRRLRELEPLTATEGRPCQSDKSTVQRMAGSYHEPPLSARTGQ